MKGTETGQYDILIGTYKGESASLIYPDIDFAKSFSCLYTRDSTYTLDTIKEQPESVKIAFNKGATYGRIIDNLLASMPAQNKMIVDEADAIHTFIDALENNKINTFIEDRAVAQYYLREHYPDRNLIEADCSPAARLYIAFSPNLENADTLVEHFEAGMREIMRNGQLKSILRVYSNP